MPNRLSMLLRCTALAAALALAACNRAEDEGNLAGLDNTLVGNDADPALTSALQDQIVVDPNLVNQSNRNAVRPPDRRPQAQYPAGPRRSVGPGGWRRRSPRARRPGLSDAANIDYNPTGRSGFPPPSRSIRAAGSAEAAGNNQGDCRSRVVTFTTADPAQRVLDFYTGPRLRSGYSAEHRCAAPTTSSPAPTIATAAPSS